MTETLSRHRVRYAYGKVADWKKRDAKLFRDLVTRAKSLPIQIRAQGLSVVVATLLREGGLASQQLADAVAQWLLAEEDCPRTLKSTTGRSDGAALLEASVNADRTQYLAAQHEALELIEHLKRLGDALCTGEGDHAG